MALSHHNDEGGTRCTRCLPVRAPYHPLGRRPRPLKHPGRPRGPSLVRPGQARGCRAAAGSGAGVALTRGWVAGLGEHRSRLAGRMTRDLARGSTGMKDGPDLEDGLHAGGNNSPRPVPDRRWSPHPVRRLRWLAKPTVVLTSPAGERARVRADPGLAVRACSPLTGAARRIRDNCQRQRAPAPAVGRFGSPHPDRGHQAALRTGTVTGRTYPPRRRESPTNWSLPADFDRSRPTAVGAGS